MPEVHSANGVSWPADQVERRSLSSLLPYAQNARTHSDAQIEQLAASIREWGWTMPVLVDESGVIVAGHGRVLAAQRLGIDEVPVMVARGWSPEKIKAYRLADNKLALLSSWDEQLLSIELADLQTLGLDDLIELTGFTENEIETLGAPDNDPIAEWVGMPEFRQNSAAAFKTIVVHFKDASAVLAFAELVKQTITSKTRFLWYPQQELLRQSDKQYTSAQSPGE